MTSSCSLFKNADYYPVERILIATSMRIHIASVLCLGYLRLPHWLLARCLHQVSRCSAEPDRCFRATASTCLHCSWIQGLIRHEKLRVQRFNGRCRGRKVSFSREQTVGRGGKERSWLKPLVMMRSSSWPPQSPAACRDFSAAWIWKRSVPFFFSTRSFILMHFCFWSVTTLQHDWKYEAESYEK